MNCKKNLLLVVLCISVATNLLAQKQQSPQQYGEASRILKYSNSVIAICNAYIEDLYDYNPILAKADIVMAKVYRNPEFRLSKPLFMADTMIVIDKSYFTDYQLSQKRSPKVKLMPTISKSIVKAEKDNVIAYQWSMDFYAYFANEEYLIDNEQNSYYQVLKDSLVHALNKARASWGETSKLAFKVGGEAENVFLSKNPMSRFTIPLKADVNLLKDLVETSYTDKSLVDWQKLIADCKTLTKQFEKAKQKKIKNLDKLSPLFQSEFDNLYDDGIICLETLQVLANVILKGTIDEETPQGFRQMENYYNDVSDTYNNVIETFNRFSSAKPERAN